jgi:hypothetical protein
VASDERRRERSIGHGGTEITEIRAARNLRKKITLTSRLGVKRQQIALRFAEKMKKRISPQRSQRAQRRNGRQARTDSQKSLSYGRRR